MADSGGYGTGQLPLACAVLCFTSIAPEQRTLLSQLGAQMGATIKLDLTSDVTHLIVGNTNSAKYRYVAKSRADVKVLLPEWLKVLRIAWLEGTDDLDMAALEDGHRVPTFHGLKMCLTGFDNPDQRKFIQDAVVQNGAEYHGDLTKYVTHLIAATPSGKKYEHAVNWRMKIVSWEWFQHSLSRGMVLDEKYYHPSIPVEERGIGALDRTEGSSPAPGKRAREAEQGHLVNPARRKLRRSASSRLGSQSEALWANITAGGLERQQNADDDWTDEGAPKLGIRKAKSPSADSNVALLDRGQRSDAQPDDPTSIPQDPLPAQLHESGGIFQGRTVLTYGFDNEKTEILRKHLDSNGAIVIRTSAELEGLDPDDLKRGFLVVPQGTATDLGSLPEAFGAMSIVSHWWVERCLYEKHLVDHNEDLLSQPFDEISITGFEDLIINSTAFSGMELVHVTKLVTFMGATYDQYLTPKISVLVCNTRKPNADKFRFATEKQIPAVHSSWLWDCLRTGELQSFDDYLLNKISPKVLAQGQQAQEPFTEIPTAPLSETDSEKLRRKQAQKAKTPSKAQNSIRKPGPLDLTLSTNLTPLSTELSTNANSVSHLPPDEEEAAIGGLDGPASMPLQDINPSVNSPRRPSHSSTSSKSRNSSTRSNSTSDASLKPAPAPIKPRKGVRAITKEPSPDSVIPPPTECSSADPPQSEIDPADTLAKILAARKAAAANAPIDKEEQKKKRRRQLGRAQSTRSNPSTAEEHHSRTSSGSVAAGMVAVEDEVRESKGYQAYQPSQELQWAAPGAQEAREQSVVKDVVSEGSGLSRARRRRG
ncbi:hypothetical protein EJ04DRAFT_511039 [Polyplosphaeria fusca]|uniref:BRCT domain-containing protein n=1 Tax=Polyplosphaeria fusca TaxID=682080 RepID=A0A9P4R492_9PLEO|nr:hypothetical protein EJ04DRAFT_511039 [Polyplosphaeria fusca]